MELSFMSVTYSCPNLKAKGQVYHETAISKLQVASAASGYNNRGMGYPSESGHMDVHGPPYEDDMFDG